MRAKMKLKKITALILSCMMIMTMALSSYPVYAAEGVMLSYNFSGENSRTAGYAEGEITLIADETNTYYLYWADDEKILDGYYEIAKLELNAGESGSFSFGYHTAIPSGATRVVAFNDPAESFVSQAVAQYVIPAEKRLEANAGVLKYSFNSYSDVHIDPDGFYKNYEEKWAQALKFATDKKADFIVTSGDMVNNGTKNEWEIYQRILAQSDYVGPVYESDGNHDVRKSVDEGLKNFVRATGTDNTIENYDANKPYYYVTEKETGDIFIFMALEAYEPHKCEAFTDEQLNWLTNLIETNYGTGKNIFIIEHAPINGFGTGDRMEKPYYGAHLSQEYWATVKFRALLEKYPDLIWMSGHTHIDYSLGYNYSDENGKACNMIHNSAVVGSTMPDEADEGLDYKDGNGYNSQGYYVEVYENNVIYYGANLTDEKIYPAYSYIMEGSANSLQTETNATEDITTATTVEKIPAVKLPGSFNEWTTVEMEMSEGFATMTMPLEAGTYEFKIMEDSTWLGNSGTIQDTTLATSAIGWEMKESDGSNCTLVASGGMYTFSYNYSTNMLTILYSSEINTDPAESTPPYESEESSETPPVSDSESSVPQESSGASESVPAETDPDESSDTAPNSETQESSSAYQQGDVNRDGVLDINDATEIQKALAELIVFDEQQYVLADTDGDGRVCVKDVTYIQQVLAKVITEEKMVVAVSSDELSGVVSSAKALLDEAYYFASYNQYQALKALYYQYKDTTSVENQADVIKSFAEKTTELNTMIDHIGYPDVYKVQDTYYFVNTLGWSEVYGYAWSNDSNKSWPGLKLEKVGTHEGYDVYGIKFKSAGEYMNIIFNGGEGKAQTVDINLSEFEYNCFTVNSSDMKDGKYIAYNFQYNNAEKEPTVPVEPEALSQYMLRYYNGSAHGWNDKDTYFSKMSDGTFVLEFTTKNADAISLNVYNDETGKYNCIASSTSVNYVAGEEQTFDLVEGSTRGKSITLNGLAEGITITFVYNPANNTVNIKF